MQRLDAGWGIATRNGCFCAQPLLNQLLGLGPEPAWTKARPGESVEIPGATRATVGVYNTHAEVDLLADALDTLCKQAKPARLAGATPRGLTA